MIFKSVARVSDDSPDTQRFRLDADVDFADDDDDELLAAFAESAIAHSRAHFDNIKLKMIYVLVFNDLFLFCFCFSFFKLVFILQFEFLIHLFYWCLMLWMENDVSHFHWEKDIAIGRDR